MLKEIDTSNIHHIIEQKLIVPHFQGIIDFSSKKMFGVESLIRTTSPTPKLTPEELFINAQSKNCLLELDTLCLQQAISAFSKQQLSGYIFINVLPTSLEHICHYFATTDISIPLTHIVLEISEKHPFNNISQLNEHILTLRNYGILIAIDDLGAGYSGLKAWAEIQPDFVKIDRHFIDGIHSDGIKREFVRSILEIARGIGCEVIAEGIETIEELEVLQSFNIKLGQGYLLHKPEEKPSSISVENLPFNSHSLTLRKINTRPTETAESILEKREPISPDIRADIINDEFKNQPHISSLPIVKNSIPVGIISRFNMLETFSGRYSHQLHGDKPIEEFMNKAPVIVDSQTSLQDISKRITNNDNIDLNTDLIITKNNHYIGIGKTARLLEELTNSQIRYARHSNPLTLLPGNVRIYEWLDSLIQKEENFWLAYFDINHFKPFNDYYGYSRGDEVIVSLSEAIVKNTSVNLDMVGHIGGDDFVVIFRSSDWKARCKKILEDFKTSSIEFYSEKEINENGIWCEDRQGKPTFFNIITLAIGVVNPDPASCQSHHDVAALASTAKHEAKKKKDNYLFVSRRRFPKNYRFEHSIT